MGDDREYMGHAVENGVIRFLSVSAAEKASPRHGGCYQRWHRRYPGGGKEAENEKSKVAKEKGVNMHARLAHYLSTGENALQDPEIKGAHMLPTPGADLWVEQKFHRIITRDTTPADREFPEPHIEVVSSLMADGIPFVGFIDFAHARGVTWTEDGIVHDPPGTVEVGDHKFKSNAKDRHGVSTFKLPSELVKTIQMAGYGTLVANTQPDARNVRLSHLYYPEKGGKPTKVTRLHVIDDCLREWEYVNGLARTLKDVARETDPNRVPGNKSACDENGGCPFREVCQTYRTTSLDNLWSKVAKDLKGDIDMGLIANNPNMMQNANLVAAQPQGYAAPAQPDMRAQLAAEEQAMRAQQQQIAPQQPQNLLTICAALQNLGRGMPKLSGAAAQAYALAGGQQIQPGAEYPGFGEWQHITLADPSHVVSFAQQVLGPQAPVQPVAPAPQPTFPQQLNQAYNQVVAGGLGVLPPGAPTSQPQLAMPQPSPAPAAEQPKKGRGRRKKDQPDTTVSGPAVPEVGAPAPQTAAPSSTPSPQTTPAAEATSATQVTPAAGPTSLTPPAASRPTITVSPLEAAVFIDCIPNGDFKPMHGYVDFINAELAKRFCVDDAGRPTTQDVRVAPKGSPLAFGGWKGAVYECVCTNPPPKGVLYLDTRGSEIAEVVADAMRTVCGKAGVLYVRGVR